MLQTIQSDKNENIRQKMERKSWVRQRCYQICEICIRTDRVNAETKILGCFPEGHTKGERASFETEKLKVWIRTCADEFET
jgi:hypothetical protein